MPLFSGTIYVGGEKQIPTSSATHLTMLGQLERLEMTKQCRQCGDDIEPPERAHLTMLCLWCGEEAAVNARSSWCIVQEYGKGPYQLVTPNAAPVTLKQTNQKELRT